MKKAFSLIEIMQTVVLLGIIAGLSISFFKKINSDQKLYLATQKQLTNAIREVGHRMCQDETPVCELDGVLYNFDDLINLNFSVGGTQYNNVWNCQHIYGGNVDAQTVDGYCKATSSDTLCATINNAIANTPAGASYESMIKGSDGKCFAPPPCPKSNIVNLEQNWKALPKNAMICPEGDPEFQASIGHRYSDNTSAPYNAFCYYFWKTVVHKPQGTDDDDDLERTCGTNQSIFHADNIKPENISGIISTNLGAGRDNYNMLLPNGVYLYNLSQGPNDIIVKYDRTNEMATANYDESKPKTTTIKVYSYSKAIYNNGNGEVTSSDAGIFDTDTWKNRDNIDKEKCPNGGLYLGTEVKNGETKNICGDRDNNSKKNCKDGGIWDSQAKTCVNRPSQTSSPTTPTGDGDNGQTTQNNNTSNNTTTQQNDGPSNNNTQNNNPSTQQ